MRLPFRFHLRGIMVQIAVIAVALAYLADAADQPAKTKCHTPIARALDAVGLLAIGDLLAVTGVALVRRSIKSRAQE